MLRGLFLLFISLSLSLLNIARPNGTMGFRTETRTKNRRLCMYVRIYTYICRKITVSCRLLPQAQNLSSQRRCEWYDEPDLKSSSSLKNGGVPPSSTDNFSLRIHSINYYYYSFPPRNDCSFRFNETRWSYLLSILRINLSYSRVNGRPG